jgi:hypothetical protein
MSVHLFNVTLVKLVAPLKAFCPTDRTFGQTTDVITLLLRKTFSAIEVILYVLLLCVTVSKYTVVVVELGSFHCDNITVLSLNILYIFVSVNCSNAIDLI